MSYVRRHQASPLSEQQYYLYYGHRYHAHSQRPPVFTSSVYDADGSWIENEGDYQNKIQQRQFTTSDWRLKLRQQIMTQTQAQTQQQQNHQRHSRGHSVHASNVNSNRTLANENDDHEKEWSTPITMAHTLLKYFNIQHTYNNRGKITSVTTPIIISGTISSEEPRKILERAFRACKDNDPAKWTIQTLFEIGSFCCDTAHTTKVEQCHADVEERVSQFLMDSFQSYMNRWTREDYCASNENVNVSGVSAHNSSTESSNNHEKVNSIEVTYEDVNKKNHNVDGDLISWDSDEDEKEGQIGYKATTQMNGFDQVNNEERRPGPVTQTHRQMLLDAISEGKNALQVFLAIDTFALGDTLSLLIPKKDVEINNTFRVDREYDTNGYGDQNTHEMENEQQSCSSDYGSLLMMNLIQRRYFHAAIQLNSRMRHFKHYHQHDQKQEKEQAEKNMASVTLADHLLANHLIDKGHPELIHLFVNTDRKLCRTVLQNIDCRFAIQIWAWIEGGIVDSSLLDPFLVVQCRAQACSSSSTTATAVLSENDSLPLLFSMLEMANSLGMSFGLENTMKSFRSTQFIQEYCTVTSLLLANQINHNPTTHRDHQKYMHRNTATTAPTIEQQRIPYLNPWMFIPSVLLILKQTPALQRLVVWMFAIREDGIATAELLASTLGLREFFSQCARQQQGDEEEDNGDLHESGKGNSDQTRRPGSGRATKAPQLIERSLIQVQEQSIGNNPSYQKRLSKEKEIYGPRKHSMETAVTEDNNSNEHEAPSPADYYSTTGALLTAPSTQVSLRSVNHNSNHAMNYNIHTLLQPAARLHNAFARPTPPPLQTSLSSAPSSAPPLLSCAPLTKTTLPTSLTSSSNSKQNKHLLIHKTYTTSPTTTSSSFSSTTTTKKQILPHSTILGYRPSPETSIILLNQMSQLEQFYDSLFNSDVVGISLIRPLAKPWAKSKHLPPDKIQQQRQLMLQQQEEETMRMKSGKSDGEGSRGRCTYLQLACSSDRRVYVVDLEVFLDEEIDPSHKFPRLIGEIFFNPSICKLVYNWFEEATFLKTLFPTLRESQYRMDNLIDLFYIWIVSNPNPNPQQSSSLHNLPVTTNTNKKIKAWYCGSRGEKKPPHLPTTMSQPRYGNVSGLLVRVMGTFLRRTSRLGWDAWTVRPLPICLQTDLAMSAQCLVDLFAVLDRDGQRKEREETVESKIQATAK